MAHQKPQRLKKELSFLKVYALATGATLSSGFFLLPGIAAASAGPAVSVSYFLAALLMVPGVLSMAELATAMPRAGGLYYFLDRSLGPLFGTIGGLGTWLALILKTAFALVGMGAYIGLFIEDLPIVPIASVLAILFGFLNYFGTKKSGGFQVILVSGLLIFLSGFIILSAVEINPANFTNYFGAGFDSIFTTTGLVYISYAGITKIASVSEEVVSPEKTLPKAMIYALISAIIIYALGTTVIVGVLPAEILHNDLTPVATTAEMLFGNIGAVLLTIAAILAFFSVANAAILGASRYPLAMSRDHLMPGILRTLSSHGTPTYGILVTVVITVICIVAFDPTKIAKLASAFQLLLFAFACLSVVIMRESKIDSYDPGFFSPWYPWIQIIGIIFPFVIISKMGMLSILFSAGLIGLGMLWYFKYARDKIERDGAIFHIFARLGQNRFDGLDHELREILKEKGLRDEDPFEVLIARSSIIDLPEPDAFENIVEMASAEIAKKVPGLDANTLKAQFMQGTRVGATPVANGVALPHLRLPTISRQEMVIVRTKKHIHIDVDNIETEILDPEEPIHALFFLISPEADPGQHLRLLAEIASRVESENFIERWFAARDEQEIKEIFHHEERFVSIVVRKNTPTEIWMDKEIRELQLPEGSLITIIYRRGEIFIPRGKTVLQQGDRLTIIGEPNGIKKMKASFQTKKATPADEA